MNKDISDKNISYQNDIRDIAKMIFHSFYFEEEQSLTYPPGSDQYEKDHIAEIYPKAEKVYRFFSNVTEAKRALKFLHEMSPVKGLEIMNSL
jgi:hypothetical protein